ncbi:MAG TPA: DUF1028 domain-containing protein, partial [bacterium]|nr:DUF1028 domain-containing protein [bacterium]
MMDRLRTLICVICVLSVELLVAAAAQGSGGQPIATFSIVARDSLSGECGVAVASRFFAVGSVVPWARAGAGAVATQSFCNTTFGWRGLDLMQQGLTPQEALTVLLR